MSDYLAVIMMGAGGGSWYRDEDRDKAIKGVARICKQDWRSLYRFPKGKQIKINVVDVEGHDEVCWDSRGFYVKSSDGRRIALDRKVEIVTHTY